MTLSKVMVFVVTSLITGGLFWALYGTNLTYDVGSSVNGVYTFSHSEEFSIRGRIIISSVFAILAGCLLTGIWYFLKSFLKTGPRSDEKGI